MGEGMAAGGRLGVVFPAIPGETDLTAAGRSAILQRPDTGSLNIRYP